jgi:hypothetical protein
MLFEPSTGANLPEYGAIKSPSALSRFLNEYGWPTLGVIRATRQEIRKHHHSGTIGLKITPHLAATD